MAGQLGGISAITLFVADLARSRDFYQRALRGRILFQDAAFADPDGTVWEVAQDLPR